MTFRRKLLLLGLGVALLTALATFIAGGVLIRRSVSDRVTERLEHEARALEAMVGADATLLPAGPSQGAGATGTWDAGAYEAHDRLADTMGQALGLRVTLIAGDGTVLGDSSLEGEELVREDNHRARPEVVAARTAGVGSARRYSDTLHEELYYLARRVDRDGLPAGFVRLAIPVHEVEKATGSYSASLGAVSFVILAIVAVAGYAAARRFSRPIETMSLTADAIAAGRHDLQVAYESADEIGRLGAAFNRMTRAFSEQIAELSREKGLRDTILGGMHEGLIVVDRQRRVLLCNDALARMLELGGMQPVARPLIEVVRDETILSAFSGALDRGATVRGTANGGPLLGKAFDVTVSPLVDPRGSQIGAIGILSDITRLTAMERMRRDFVADVSHELRTPLTSIKAFVETLSSGGLEDSDNNRRFLDIIQKHADRMSAILDDLTDLSLIETGSVALELAPCDIAAIGRELADALRSKADAARVTLTVEVPKGVTVMADRRRLEQVLSNLLENAVKFNKPGGSVTLWAERIEAQTPSVRVVVSDTGIGIPTEELDKIFRRFYRVDRGKSSETGGSGLGLAITKHLMSLHGGSIRAESEPGRGSRFVLEFPNPPVRSPTHNP